MVNVHVPPAVVLNILYKGQFKERRKKIQKRREGETEEDREITMAAACIMTYGNNSL